MPVNLFYQMIHALLSIVLKSGIKIYMLVDSQQTQISLH
uniref:Hypotheticial protein n=1 Tax=Schistosoma japonicum TaxID=6182 RepID=C1LG97_SCHJA|nr:hypotheticial protein [Schistosoma japonicum]